MGVLKGILIEKNGEKLANSASVKSVVVRPLGFPEMRIFYSPRVTMERKPLLLHIQNTPLSAFFDESYAYVLSDDPLSYGQNTGMTNGYHSYDVGKVHYLHGMSEVLNGRPSVHSVFLVSCNDPGFDKVAFVTRAPFLYRHATRYI
jgi:hypothetical protein